MNITESKPCWYCDEIRKYIGPDNTIKASKIYGVMVSPEVLAEHYYDCTGIQLFPIIESDVQLDKYALEQTSSYFHLYVTPDIKNRTYLHRKKMDKKLPPKHFSDKYRWVGHAALITLCDYLKSKNIKHKKHLTDNILKLGNKTFKLKTKARTVFAHPYYDGNVPSRILDQDFTHILFANYVIYRDLIEYVGWIPKESVIEKGKLIPVGSVIGIDETTEEAYSIPYNCLNSFDLLLENATKSRGI